jgi:uncharacterized membrane protein YfcA
MSGSEIIVLLLAVGVAAVVQNIVGFGFALLAVPLMVVAVDPHDAVIISTFLGLGSSSFQAFNGRHEAQRGLIVRLSLSALVGIPVGLLVFNHVDERFLKGCLAAGIFLAVFVLTRSPNLSHANPRLEIGAGFLSGALSSSLSTNGPPLVFALQGRGLPIAQFRATISAIFTISGVITLASFIALRKVNYESLLGVLMSLPVLGLGILIGQRLKPRLNEENSRRFVLVLLSAAGCSALVGAFVG